MRRPSGLVREETHPCQASSLATTTFDFNVKHGIKMLWGDR